jgi:hypothetical protein
MDECRVGNHSSIIVGYSGFHGDQACRSRKSDASASTAPSPSCCLARHPEPSRQPDAPARCKIPARPKVSSRYFTDPRAANQEAQFRTSWRSVKRPRSASVAPLSDHPECKKSILVVAFREARCQPGATQGHRVAFVGPLIPADQPVRGLKRFRRYRPARELAALLSARAAI